MAPEQINGKPRPASDQYALGIVIYEWLSGERPFNGSFGEIATQHLMIPPAALYGRVADVSPAMEEVVFTALAKDPQQRYASVQDLAIALEQACERTQCSSTCISPSNYFIRSVVSASLRGCAAKTINAANLCSFTVRSSVRIYLCGHAAEPAAIMGWRNYTTPTTSTAGEDKHFVKSDVKVEQVSDTSWSDP